MPLRLEAAGGCGALVGVGGIGTGMFFALEGDRTLGRNESRPGRLLDVRDYCKLHIISHYAAVLLGAKPSGRPFHVVPVGLVGNDTLGRRLVEEMAAAGLDTNFVRAADSQPTLFSVCFQYPDGSGGNITTSDAAASAITESDVEAVREIFEANRTRAVALAAPEVPLEARLALLRLAGEYDALKVAAFASAEVPAARSSGIFEMVDLLAVNEDEAAALTGSEFDPTKREAFLDRVAGVLLRQQPQMKIILSVGKAGAYAYEAGRWEYCPAAEVAVASTAGAGDALVGGIIAGLAAGLPLTSPAPRRKALGERPLETALDLGVLLAAFSVTSPHTIHPGASLESLLAFAGEVGVAFGEKITGRFAD